MTINLNSNVTNKTLNQDTMELDVSLNPKSKENRTVGPITYLFMWIGL